ncbi:hypothetical protein EGR_10226 [Echinococcus granulosus]|uniref:Uncharacterized protein n=1 Tax=Echinococcus granulosus TaxID=6210 RepID=W6U2V8_ECHGR|nr:hypothetical protein EGR_10226 [Echinococcus granulosus]EUB54916.1 hypothetical protein EGR_10226 [Echinococcus granulosus]
MFGQTNYSSEWMMVLQNLHMAIVHVIRGWKSEGLHEYTMSTSTNSEMKYSIYSVQLSGASHSLWHTEGSEMFGQTNYSSEWMMVLQNLHMAIVHVIRGWKSEGLHEYTMSTSTNSEMKYSIYSVQLSGAPRYLLPSKILKYTNYLCLVDPQISVNTRFKITGVLIWFGFDNGAVGSAYGKSYLDKAEQNLFLNKIRGHRFLVRFKYCLLMEPIYWCKTVRRVKLSVLLQKINFSEFQWEPNLSAPNFPPFS